LGKNFASQGTGAWTNTIQFLYGNL
jgi:hypothetical protein